MSDVRFNTSIPHPARRYDYWLGGKDNFAADRESADAIAAAAAVLDAMSAGSYLVLSHVTYDFLPPATAAELNAANAARNVEFRPRSRAEFTRFFDGLELVPPGVTSVAEWRAEDAPKPRPSTETTGVYGAVARKA